MSGWSFFIDRGGTFTDCVAVAPDGSLRVLKVLSSDDAPVIAIRQALGIERDPRIAVNQPPRIPPCEVRLGTTIATNALLEHRGVPVTLVTTRGLEDVLALGTQARPRLFSLEIVRPQPIASRSVAVSARATARGEILDHAHPEELASLAGAESVAIVPLFGHLAPELEREIEAELSRLGVSHVSKSSEVDPKLGLLARAETTSVDAHLTPLLSRHVRALEAALPDSDLRFMQSSGDLVDARRFRGHNAILSGPAGGAVAVARLAERLGALPAIGLDIGGTSTDVSRYDGALLPSHETEIAGLSLRTPMLDVHTVAAGGGSICRFDGHRFSVGPDSAGAIPGPLAYGHPEAKDLTLTDVNLALGRILPDRFPFPLDTSRPRAALEAIAQSVGDGRSAESVAEGFLAIAHAHIADAIRKVTTARGHDVRTHTLVVFGGAGGQHACWVARELGTRRILIHPLGGVFSAFGIGLADVGWHGHADGRLAVLTQSSLAGLVPSFESLVARGARETSSVPFEPKLTLTVGLRYVGSEAELEVPAGPNPGQLSSAEDAAERFRSMHESLFGYSRPGHPIEIVTARVAVRRSTSLAASLSRGPAERPGSAGHLDAPKRSLHLNGRSLEAPAIDRATLAPGDRVSGPCVLCEATGTVVVADGFEVTVLDDSTLELLDRAPAHAEPLDPAKDPVRLELFARAFDAIAEQMGVVLRRTALSTNIRERLDFSCAIFDRTGELVSNAPYIPVHLGAMGESVRAVISGNPGLRANDVFATNDPSAGGSHLPDITVVTPVFDALGVLRFFTASRGHHADVGGITPGSMPPFAKRLEDEGVVLSGLKIVDQGRFQSELVRAALLSSPYPARRPDENLADLEAQIAANRTGAVLLLELCARHGPTAVDAYTRHVMDHAELAVREALRTLPRGRFGHRDALDDGAPIEVMIETHDPSNPNDPSLTIDFAGTGGELEGNLNAPKAVTLAAIIYVLRCLVGRPIPLNAGCLRPVRVLIPEGSLLAPSRGRAVAGGNVETSQRVVDVLLGALGLAAASQGTMNNLTFGNDKLGYYETIAGGAGAGPSFDGASAVHTHMTNTRITDAEVLEARFPVRVVEHSIRRGSGGRGARRGGDGVIRELELLEPLSVSILSERRTQRPFGLAGGEPGAAGRNTLDGADLGGKAAVHAPRGARLRIETPGGGGYGSAL